MGLTTHLRPEMANFNPPSDVNEAMNRIQPNIAHFQVNYFYMVIFFTSLYVAINNPYSLIGMAILIAIPTFLSIYKDPIKIGDNYVTMPILARVYILLGIIFYASFAGVHFLIALLLSFLVIVSHAIIHDVETTRTLNKFSSPADYIGQDASYIIKRGHDLFLVAIGAEDSSEVYNMASVPQFMAKEIKQDLKDIKASVKDLFK